MLSFQVDLLIATCGLVSAGHLRDPTNLLQCVGNNPYADGSAECSTEMQLYSGSDNGMLVLQQRAPPMLGRYMTLSELCNSASCSMYMLAATSASNEYGVVCISR